VLVLGLVAALGLRSWLRLRRVLLRRDRRMPAVVAVALAALALVLARRPGFHTELGALQALVGGSAEAERVTIAHQVYAAYRRSDPASLARMLERGRVYEPTVREAAAAYDVDPEVLMGVAAAESAFNPRDSSDGGRGLFQITAAPAEATASVRRRLEVTELDPLNQRHNAFLAAATLHLYFAEMSGDPFLALLAYNIGPRNGGLRTVMQQYGARDFVTIQPYLQQLPRDYPIRVLAAALAYRLWRTEGRLPRYEDGDNARRIQRVGIPGLDAREP
jgi:soluble lytic murein transglycosylase-like protein